MGNLFSGLDKLGLNPDAIGNLYDEAEDAKNPESAVEQDTKKKTINEAEFIFDKTMTCPACGRQFKTKAVRTGKAKLLGTDTDMKPIYDGFEPLKYDVIVCLHCGYAATTKSFGHITPGQVRMLREGISRNFKGITNSLDIYNYFDALDRHKLALANAVVIKMKSSEKAYICLKMAWIYRSMVAAIPKTDEMMKKLCEDYKAEEKKCLASAYEGFTTSLAKEIPPICGMDANTVTYLIADIARRIGDYEGAKKYLNVLLGARVMPAKLRERARILKENLDKVKNDNEME